MSKTVYYGRTTKFVGKTLFEILANLRNFGIGRVVYKHTELKQFPNSYYIVRDVEPVMDQKLELGVVHAEKIFNGARASDLVTIDEETWHTDWRLVLKEDEKLFKVSEDKLVDVSHPSKVEVFPRWMDTPPLMEIFLRRKFKNKKLQSDSIKGIDSNQPLKIRLRYLAEIRDQLPHLHRRVAEEGETPSFPSKTSIGLLPSKFKPNPDQMDQKKA